MPSPRKSRSPGTRMRPASRDAASAAHRSAPATRISCPSGMRDGRFSRTPRVTVLRLLMGGAQSDTTGAVLAALSAAAVGAAAVSLVWVDRLPTGRSAIRDAVSDHGADPRFRLFYRVLVVLLGLGAALLLVALASGTGVARGGLIWLGVYAVSRVAIAWFPTDLPGAPVTPVGRVHLVLAALAFTAIAFAAVDLTTSLGDEPGWEGLSGVLSVSRWAVVIAAVCTLLARAVVALRPWFGLVERLLYAASVEFLLLVAVKAALVL